MEMLIENVVRYIKAENKSMGHHDKKYPTTVDIKSVDGNATYLLRSLQSPLGNLEQECKVTYGFNRPVNHKCNQHALDHFTTSLMWS